MSNCFGDKNAKLCTEFGLESFAATYDIKKASGGFFNEGEDKVQGCFPSGSGPFPL